jgi:hypothetical protein
MAHVGPRILFYDADRPRKDADALVEYAKHQDIQQRIDACRAQVRDFLLLFHRVYPPDTVKSSSVAFGDSHLRHLALCADVLTRLRARTPRGSESEVEPIEHPERVLGMLKNVAIGSALVHGRVAVDDYDLAQVRHIALSSGVAGRGRVRRALLDNGRTASTWQVEALAGVSTPTALQHMKGLQAVGQVLFIQGKGAMPASIQLLPEYVELCAPLRKAKREKGGGRHGQRKAKRGGRERPG